MTSAATPAPTVVLPTPLLTTPRLSTTRRSSPLPTWFFLLVALSFLLITLSLLLTSPTSTHPCPYADVLGLDNKQQPHTPAAVRSVPAGHMAVEGLSEDDCPHLMIERMAAERRTEAEERRRRVELGVLTEEDRRVERREREEEDEMRRFEE